MRELRRKDRAMEKSAASELLRSGEYGVLSSVGEDGMPYGVPLNYVVMDGNIYFHAAKAGHKLDNIKQNNQVSFCVVGKTRIIPEKYTSEFESVIVFGKAGLIAGEEKEKALLGLLAKYSPDFPEEEKQEIKRSCDIVEVIKIEILHICGKAHQENEI